jgi:acetyltransferase-like isoleucine patch superfamily enzyme
MDWFRLRHTIALHLKSNGFQRADYVREHGLFRHVGAHCMFMFRKLPLYGELISVGDNVHFASNVSLITHDVTHNMLNRRDSSAKMSEYAGCIEIGNNVFVGANSTILYNSRIPSDTIIGANSLVNKPLDRSGVWAGTPVRYICSLEDFLKKRAGYQLKIKKNKTRLSQQTVEEAWKSFRADQK